MRWLAPPESAPLAGYGTRNVCRRALFIATVVIATCATTACSGSSSPRDARQSSPRGIERSGVPPASATATSLATSSTVAPPSTTADPPAFAGVVSPVTAADLPYSYRAGCPVPPEDLRLLHVSYWGFDAQAHPGAIVVHADVADDVVTIFSKLYDERFPIRRMVPVDQYQGSDPASMDADNTSGFNCRAAVASGPPQWSAHAYGEAIDVNPVENPYVFEGDPQPSAAAAYLDRTNVRPGMAVAGGQLVDAFASVGWQWGGRWSDSPDYQHFSRTGA
jgi:D-alanyl-D-alanine carboxypeptidase